MTATSIHPSSWICLALGFALHLVAVSKGFQTCSPRTITTPSAWQHRDVETALQALTKKRPYVPKWKKKITVAEQEAMEGKQRNIEDIGIIGTVPIVFKTGNTTLSTIAKPGQPLKEVAMQAGQFIKYGCGKGECKTCESLCVNTGQKITPCIAKVPEEGLEDGEEYIIELKKTKMKSKSSGRFYSVRSFLFGFYNNVLGMVAMVFWRKKAKKNWDDRKSFEELVAQKTAEKKAARLRSDNGEELLP